MKSFLAAFATYSTRTVRTGCQAISSRVQCLGAQMLGTVRGQGTLAGGPFRQIALTGLDEVGGDEFTIMRLAGTPA